MDWLAALLNRVDSLAGGKVYWGERPQTTTLPALVLTMVSDDRPQHLKGFSLSEGRVQFDAYGRTHKEAWDLAEAAIAAAVPGGAHDGHNFSRADVSLGPRDLAERVGNSIVFRVSMDLTFFHAPTEAVS